MSPIACSVKRPPNGPPGREPKLGPTLGRVPQVVTELRRLASLAETTTTQTTVLTQVANYFERNTAYMHYDQYLADGWPIASGVIEGACRHLVKDRCELSGMRWTPQGVEDLLHLRPSPKTMTGRPIGASSNFSASNACTACQDLHLRCLKTKPWLIQSQRARCDPQDTLSLCRYSSHAAQRSRRNEPPEQS